MNTNKGLVSGGLSVVLLVLLSSGCNSSSYTGPPLDDAGALATDSAFSMPPVDASRDASDSDAAALSDASVDDDGDTDASDGAPPDSATGQPDAGACAPCPSMYSCVAAPSGLQLTYADTQDSDGTCHVSGLTLLCGGTGTAANGSPITWTAGDDLGPSGGAGISVLGTGLQLNCE